MITLNTERGLIKVDSWEDVEALPGFSNNVDLSEHTLKEIIGRYQFKEKQSCGLSNCHRPHSKGYVVTTTKGLTTNIGKDCGKTHFGVDFEELAKKFDRNIEDSQNRDRLWSHRFQVEELEQSLNSLLDREYGAKWVQKGLRQFTQRGLNCPETIVRKIRDMVKTGVSVLSIERKATELELEAMEATGSARTTIINEPVATIEGLQAFDPEYDLRSLLVVGISSQIAAFKDLEIDQLSSSELRHWVIWADSIEGKMKAGEQAVQYGNQFLSKQNLSPFAKLLSDRIEVTQFNELLRSLRP